MGFLQFVKGQATSAALYIFPVLFSDHLNPEKLLKGILDKKKTYWPHGVWVERKCLSVVKKRAIGQ